MKASTLALLAAGTALLAGQALADDCDAVASASLKQTGVPYRTEMTIAASGEPAQKGEAVYMVTKLYTKMGGNWSSMPINAQQMSKQIQASIKNGNTTCKKAGAESVGGEAATIYVTHGTQQGNVVDTRTWISNSRNLPLRSEAVITNGANRQTVDMTISYDNVSAPAGVQ
jgi:hypothetical protein